MTGTACAILAMFNFCLNVAICASVGGISCGTIILYDVSNKLLGVVFIWLFNILYNILTNRIEYNAQNTIAIWCEIGLDVLNIICVKLGRRSSSSPRLTKERKFLGCSFAGCKFTHGHTLLFRTFQSTSFPTQILARTMKQIVIKPPIYKYMGK